MQIMFLIFIAPVGLIGLSAAWKAACNTHADAASGLAGFRRGAYITFAIAAFYFTVIAAAGMAHEYDGVETVRQLEKLVLGIGATMALAFAFSVLAVGGYTVAYLVFEKLPVRAKDAR